MKRCPQCQRTFTEDNSFCLEDGTPLIPDLPQTVAYSPPPTVPHKPSFVVDLSPPKPEIPTQFTPIPPVSPMQTAKKSSTNYAVPLLIGLLLGGILVLALFFIMRERDEKPVANNSNNSNSSKNETSKSSPVSNNSKKTDNSSNINSAVNKSEEDDKYNGRVIMINANLRSAPDTYADTLETLPLDERIVIGRREHSNSPWYRVTCEHGTSGWMHGNTIEFTR